MGPLRARVAVVLVGRGAASRASRSAGQVRCADTPNRLQHGPVNTNTEHEPHEAGKNDQQSHGGGHLSRDARMTKGGNDPVDTSPAGSPATAGLAPES